MLECEEKQPVETYAIYNWKIL